MSPVEITEHAVERYCERVANLPRERVRALLMRAAPTILLAATMGARSVKLSDRCRLVLVGARVVTVISDGLPSQPDGARAINGEKRR